MVSVKVCDDWNVELMSNLLIIILEHRSPRAQLFTNLLVSVIIKLLIILE